jgi:FkbM family methyltransferase
MRTVFPQDAEEELKHAFFAGTEPGFFVEVGANEPREISQTYGMEQRGWRGVLIEPQPDLAGALRRERTAQVFAVACSSRANAGSQLTLHLAGGHSSFDEKLNLAGVKPHGAISVPVRTLDDILQDAGATAIDFMSIDVEGHELEVLDGFSLERWRPRLLLIEDLLLHRRLHNTLTQRDYRLIRRTGINNWYVPAKAAPPLGPDGAWQLFNKVHLGVPLRRARFAWRRMTTERKAIG